MRRPVTMPVFNLLCQDLEINVLALLYLHNGLENDIKAPASHSDDDM